MIIGSLRLEFRLHGNDSLKGKRQVANSLKQKIRNKFNVAVAEVERQDSLDTLVLAVVAVSNETSHVESQLSKVISMAEAATSEELADAQMEIFGA